MFYPKGWISLREAFEFIRFSYSSKPDHPKWGEFTGDENFETTWSFVENVGEIAVCSKDGKALNASLNLVIAENVYDHCNQHINLLKGTVGSSDWPGNDGKPKSKKQLKEEYGPFLYLPVLFKKTDFVDFVSEFEGNNSTGIDNSPRATMNRIIEMFDKNGAITFETAKNECGKNQSIRKFRFAWNLAREERPDISRPGPRPTLR